MLFQLSFYVLDFSFYGLDDINCNFSCTIFYLFISFFLDVADWPITRSKTYFPNNPRQVYFGVIYSFPENFSNSVGVHLDS